MPLVGFYLQPAVGGIQLDVGFWTRFAAIPNVVAIKVAPFNRYRTLDVLRGIAEAGAEERITLYTGNDDHIVLDLVTPFTVMREGQPVTLRFRGGLLGHWSVWTAECRAPVGSAAMPRTARCPTTCWRWMRASPTATPPSSTWRTISMAASPGAMKCCAGRACWRASGASIRPRD